jgi:hypothetical protein
MARRPKKAPVDAPVEPDDEALAFGAPPMEADEPPEGPQPSKRSEDLTDDSDLKEDAIKLYDSVARAFDGQKDRTNDILDYWDLYNCKLGPRQVYAGNSQLFVPLIHDAVNARVTRFVNQMFPRSERYVDVTTSDGTIPFGIAALLEHYIKKAGLRPRVMPALMRCGDVEGQYTVYVDWVTIERWMASRQQDEFDLGDLDPPDEDDGAIVEERVTDAWPGVEVISDPDFVVSPATADSIEEAFEQGGHATIIRRWSETKIQAMVDAKEIDETAAETLLAAMKDDTDTEPNRRDVAKTQTDAAGIRRDARGNYALVYETWTMLELPEGRRLCRIYYGGEDCVLSIRRNPHWSDLCPILSTPVEKVHGSFKGRSKIAPVADFQLAANDALNEGMDSAAYALMPIIMTDPEKNPRVASMILSLAAVWETSPNDTQFAQFPQLWKDAFEIVNSAKQQVFSTLSVNPAMITQGNPYRKPTQAEVAAEQQVDVLTTADAVTIVEGGVLTPMVQRMVALDHQFRNEALTVKQYGEMGLRARMESIKPIQFDRHWQFKWFGVEAARSAQQIQQQIAAINVIRTIPPALYQGYRLDLAPAITQLVESAFGPYLAPLIFKDLRSQLSNDPAQENQILMDGLDLPVHPLDDHEQHMAVHIKALREAGPGGDANGSLRIHLLQHQAAMAQAQAAAAQQLGGMPGEQESGPAPGTPGQPRPGAQPAGPRPGQGPAGMIHQDRMQDPAVMPRTNGSSMQ